METTTMMKKQPAIQQEAASKQQRPLVEATHQFAASASTV